LGESLEDSWAQDRRFLIFMRQWILEPVLILNYVEVLQGTTLSKNTILGFFLYHFLQTYFLLLAWNVIIMRLTISIPWEPRRPNIFPCVYWPIHLFTNCFVLFNYRLSYIFYILESLIYLHCKFHFLVCDLSFLFLWSFW
jgi:hypothetical protein